MKFSPSSVQPVIHSARHSGESRNPETRLEISRIPTFPSKETLPVRRNEREAKPRATEKKEHLYDIFLGQLNFLANQINP